MAECRWCRQEMTEAAQCTVAVFHQDGVAYLLPRWGSERRWSRSTGRCPDCSVQPGGLHHPGCDIAECPGCGGQLCSCDCLFDEDVRGRDDDDDDDDGVGNPVGGAARLEEARRWNDWQAEYDRKARADVRDLLELVRTGRPAPTSQPSRWPPVDPVGSAPVEEPLTDLVRAAALARSRGQHGAGYELATRIDRRWATDKVGLVAVEAMLVEATAEAWAKGYQPGELARLATRRLGKPGADIVGAAVVAGAAAYRDDLRVDAAWLAQVDALGRAGARPGWLGAIRSYRPGDSVVGAFALLTRLPVLDVVAPRPGAWRDGDESAIDAKVLTRVRALLAKAESTTYVEEAEALVAKAQELMARYSIDQASLHRDGAEGHAPGLRRITVEDPYASAKALLLTDVAKASGCQCLWLKDIGSCAVFGFPADVAGVELLFTSLLAQAASAMHAAQPASRDGASTIAFRRSFLASYAERIGDRLTEATRKIVAEAVAVDDSLLPVLAAREEEVLHAFEERFPNARTSRISVTDARGRRAGLDAADRADLGATRAVDVAGRPALGP